MTKTTAAKYRRISDDREGRELGVTRQDEDLDDLARRRGYEVVADYTDNDIGASTRSRKRRPGYAQMVEDARAGKFKVILAYTSSRLTRRPREHEDLIELAEQHRVKFEYVRSPSFDLNTSAGRRVARILAANDAGESEDISERVSRARRQQAEQGRYGGGARRYGHELDGTERPDEAAEIRKAADAVLAGVGLRGIVADLNARQVPTSKGGRWTHQSLRGMLLQPRLVGLMTFEGQVVEDAPPFWAPILEQDAWLAVRAVLNSPERRTSPGPTPKWLGSGLYRCGHPEHGDAVVTMRSGTAGTLHYPVYRCSQAAHLVRTSHPLDDYIEQVIVERLSRPDAVDLLTPRPDVNTKELAAQANEIRARIGEAGDLWEDGTIGAAEYRERKGRLEAKLLRIEAEMTAGAGRSPLSGLAGNPDAAAVWEGLDLGRRRAVLDALMTVTVLPRGRRGRGFDPESVRVDWLQP